MKNAIKLVRIITFIALIVFSMAGCVLEEFEDCTYCKGSGICSDCKGSGRSLYEQPYIAKGQVYNKISHAYEDKYTIYAGSCYSCSGGDIVMTLATLATLLTTLIMPRHWSFMKM
jgi:DnaJ-class molecular chaperone